MKLAFCLFHYFPFGGLQRDFLRIAKACVARGHQVDIYTMGWEGERDPLFSITVIPVSGWQNHTRADHYVRKLQNHLTRQHYDVVIGFNKMPGLDIYYAADTCYQAKIHSQRRGWYALLPRYRHLIRYEKAVFSPEKSTLILSLAKKQQIEFRRYYQTPAERFHLLPPGIDKSYIAPFNRNEIRDTLRNQWGITQNTFLVLAVGSGFKTKGLDRSIKSIASLPEALKTRVTFFVIGQNNPAYFKKCARKLNVAEQIHFLGGRNDVPDFLCAADLLLHPARNENTGTVLLEAIISGLPVLTTDVCGYAEFIQKADAGIVLPSPFQQAELNQTLIEMLQSPRHKIWCQNGLDFSKQNIYGLAECATTLIESFPARDTVEKILFSQGEIYRSLEGRSTKKVQLQNNHYFVKQHTGVGWKEIFKNIIQLRLPVISAKNEWKALQRLSEIAILAPKIIAYGCNGKNPATLKSFLITEALPESISLEDLCKNKIPRSLKYKLIDEVATIARRLHAEGINHRDFYLCHFLVDGVEWKKGKIKLYVIDLHRAQSRKQVPTRWKIKDLAGLYFSSKGMSLTKRDFFRFIKTYNEEKNWRIVFNEANTLFWKKVKKRGDQCYQKHAAYS